VPCRAQSYTLRSNFFDYLGTTYGDEVLLRMAAQDEAGALVDYRRFFGKGFEALAAEWREHLRKTYRKMNEADETARRYRNETPVNFMAVCHEGDQF
jgi:hypothetical protein